MPQFGQVPTPGSHWVKTFEDFVAYVDENLEILTLVSFDYHLGGPKTGADAILYLEEKVVEALSNTPGYTPPVVDINSAMGWTCRQLRGPAAILPRGTRSAKSAHGAHNTLTALGR